MRDRIARCVLSVYPLEKRGGVLNFFGTSKQIAIFHGSLNLLWLSSNLDCQQVSTRLVHNFLWCFSFSNLTTFFQIMGCYGDVNCPNSMPNMRSWWFMMMKDPRSKIAHPSSIAHRTRKKEQKKPTYYLPINPQSELYYTYQLSITSIYQTIAIRDWNNEDISITQ
jgi:hypothetical protein